MAGMRKGRTQQALAEALDVHCVRKPHPERIRVGTSADMIAMPERKRVRR
jgi:hypothetical protein